MRWTVKREGTKFVAVLNEIVGRRVVERNRIEGFTTAGDAWKAAADRNQEQNGATSPLHSSQENNQ